MVAHREAVLAAADRVVTLPVSEEIPVGLPGAHP
jgi:hypothetical protein